MEHIDIVVVGAGLFGLTIVKTFLEVYPDVSIALLEAGTSLGGTWSKERLYPGLKTNNLLGTYESPDFPLTPEKFDVKPKNHIPGTVLQEYFTQYADKFGVTKKIRLNSKVEEVAENSEGRWIISVTDPEPQGQTKNILANKLIIATGLTGNPNMPEFPGVSKFDRPVFHAKEFLQHKELLKEAKTVAVYGGGKSAWDAVYAYASEGVQVEWVIRESGRGPCWMTPMWVMGGKKWLETLVFTRALTWFNPTVWGANDGYGFIKRFFHETFVGRLLVRTFWGGMEKDVLGLNKFESHPEMMKLKPWSGSFWSGTSLSILNYPTDFYDHIRSGMVRVYHSDITELSPNSIHLSTGETLEVDALHCSTGWKHQPPIKFSPPSLATKLGYPGPRDPATIAMDAKVDAEIVSRFPMLKDQPNVTPKRDPAKGAIQEKELPYRLYRWVIPPARFEKRNFAAAGVFLSLAQPVTAQIQALWILSYFEGSLQPRKSPEEMAYETELFQRFGRWRYPGGYGGKVGDFVFENLPYCDNMLEDLGLRFKRKSSWLKELYDVYTPRDYVGLTKEWMEKRKTDKKNE